MELREYYKILKSNVSVIIYTVLLLVVIVYAWSVRESEKFSAELLLNIGRLNTQSTQEYRYDQFYQVQADEKFSQTIEQWLQYPGIVSEIFDKAGLEKSGKSMGQLAKSFSAERISPESVLVKFSAQNENDAKKIADAIGTVADEKTSEINSQAKDPAWFKIIPSNLIILKNIQDLRINLGFALMAGLLLGSFFALLKHYLSEEKK